MKAHLIAIASLALSGAALTQVAMAQTATDPAASTAETAADPAVTVAPTPGEAAKSAAQEAADAAAEAAKAAGEAMREGASAAGQAAGDAAEHAREAADAAARSAGEAVDKAATAAEGAARDAAAATEKAAEKAADDAQTAIEGSPEAVTPPDVQAPAISAADPGVLGSWITSRRIWSTNQPSTTPWDNPTLTERPVEWTDIAKVDDVVLDADGNLIGYLADIGGFLGIGAKKVLLGRDAIHLIQIGNDWFYATNFTKAELEALPNFDPATIRK